MIQEVETYIQGDFFILRYRNINKMVRYWKKLYLGTTYTTFNIEIFPKICILQKNVYNQNFLFLFIIKI